MKYSFALVLTFLSPLCVLSQVTLVESGPGTARPGESIRLTCKVTGYSISSPYWWSWIRQPPGKGLEWVGMIHYSGSPKHYAPSLQSRTSISKDDDRNEFYLQMSSLTATDTATYYCAGGGNWPAFDYWGPGTFVTVTSASQTPPSLFPLIPSSDSYANGDVTIGCLAKDFLPDSLTFSWQKPNNDSLEASKIRQFPSIMKSTGVFITSAEATIPSSQWNTFEPFFCKAEHPAETKVTRVVRQTPIVCLPPTVVVRVPPLEDFLGPYLNATLFCKASSLHTERTTITWMKNGNVLTSGFTTTAPVREGRGSFSIISELIVTRKDWYTKKIFSCQVKNEKFNEIRNVSMLAVGEGCEGTNAQVHVETIPPSFDSIYLTKSANLTCRISNIPIIQDLDELNVTWIRERDSTPLETKTGQPKEQENRELVFVDATATICLEEWDSGDNYLCNVKFPLLASTETKSLKKQNGGSHSPPSVYVLPPPAEQLALRETATVTCLLKDFFPNDIFVRWMRNDELVEASEYYISQPIRESTSPERYFTYSTLNVKEQDWSYGATYTCVVGHEALPLQTTQKTVDKSTGKPTFVNVSLVLSDVASSCH